MVDYGHGPILSCATLLLLRRFLCFCIPVCIFILIFNICGLCPTTQSNRVFCPLATIQLASRERAAIGASTQYRAIEGLYFFDPQICSDTLSSPCILSVFFLLSLLFCPWKGKVDAHFSLFVLYRPLMGPFISQQNTYSDSSNSDLILDLCLVSATQRSMGEPV